MGEAEWNRLPAAFLKTAIFLLLLMIRQTWEALAAPKTWRREVP